MKYSVKKRNIPSRKDYYIISMQIMIILAFLFQLILAGMIGDKGMACYGVAFQWVVLLSGVIGYGLSEAVAQLVRYRVKREQYRETQKILGAAVTLGAVSGILAGLLTAAFGSFLAVKIVKIPLAELSFGAVSPAIVCFILIYVMQGYFRGNGSRVPTNISRIMQGILLLAGGLLGAGMFQGYGKKVSALLQNEDYTSAYGAMGASAWILLPAVLTLLYLAALYLLYRRNLKAQSRELSKAADGSLHVFHMLISGGALYSLFFLVTNGKVLAGEMILMSGKAAAESLLSEWGRFYGKVLPIIGIAEALICILLLPAVRRLLVLEERDETRLAREKLKILIHQGAAVSIPAAVFLAVFSENVLNVLYGGNNAVAAGRLAFSAVGIVFFTFMTLFLEILSKGRKHLLAAGISGAAFLVYLGVLFIVESGKLSGINGLVFAELLSLALAAGGSFYFICRRFSYRQEWLKTFAVTVVAAAVSGTVGMLLNKGLSGVLGDLISLLICLVISILIYVGILIVLRAFGEEELENMAGGMLYKKLAEMLHFM